MSLSNDLVEYILSFLQSDLVTLENCAKSHPTLSELSERYIYADVTLRDDYESTRVPCLPTSEFTKILAKRPGIAKYVRRLTVRVGFRGTFYMRNAATRSHFKGVARLLPTFSRLTELKIEGNKQHDWGFNWQSLPDIFQEAFLHFLHAKDKKQVTISHAACFPLSLLNNCENVTMTLDHCENTEYDFTEDVFLSCPGPFEHLSLLYCSETCLQSTTAWLQTHSLRSLEYEVEWESVKAFRELFPGVLVACSNSLTNLCLDINNYFQTSYKISDNSAIFEQYDVVLFPFTLAGLSRLERLTVKAYVWRTRYEIALKSPIPAIVKLISTPPTSFKQIFLEFQYSNSEDVWFPFVPLAATCSPLSITVHISAPFPSGDSFLDGGCGGLIPYVEKGVVVIHNT